MSDDLTQTTPGPTPAPPVGEPQGPQAAGATAPPVSPTPVSGPSPTEFEALKSQVKQYEDRLRGLMSSSDRRMNEIRQQYEQQLAAYQAQAEEQAKATMTPQQQLQFERDKYAQMAQQYAAAFQQMQGIEQARMYKEQLTAYFAKETGAPREYLEEHGRTPQEMQAAAFQWMRTRGVQQPTPQQFQQQQAMTPQQQQQAWQPPQQQQQTWQPPQTTPVTSHSQAAQNPDIVDKLENLADYTKEHSKSTVFEALTELENMRR